MVVLTMLNFLLIIVSMLNACAATAPYVNEDDVPCVTERQLVDAFSQMNVSEDDVSCVPDCAGDLALLISH